MTSDCGGISSAEKNVEGGEQAVRAVPMRQRLLSSLRWLMIPTNPVFMLEMRTSGRQRSTYINRLMFSLVLLGIITLTYVGASFESSFGASGVGRAQELQTIAPTLAVWISFLLLGGLIFTGPSLVGGSICDERRAGTLPATLTTPLTAGQIIVGKVASKFVHVLVLMSLAVPLLLALRLFGGLETGWIVGAALIILSYTLLAMSIAVLYSLRAARGSMAAGGATFTAFLVPGLLSLVLVYHTSRYNTTLPSGMPLTYIIPWFFSPATLGFMTSELFWGAGGTSAGVWGGWQWNTPWLGNVLLNLVASGLVLFVATRMLRNTMRTLDEKHILPPKRRSSKSRERRSAKRGKAAREPAEDAGEPSAAVGSELSGLREAERVEVERDGSRAVSDRPVLWRELSQPAFRSVYVKVVAILACLVGLAWLYIDVGIDTPATNMMIPIIGTLLLVVMVANSSSGSIATEREAKTWGLLLTTPLRPRQIMMGKMGGAIRRQWLIFGVLGLHIGCQVLAGVMPAVVAVGLVAVLVSTCVFVSSVGTAAALVTKSSKRATAITLLVLAALWIFPFVTIGIIESIGLWYDIDEALLPAANFVNPMYYVFALSEVIENSSRSRLRFEWHSGKLDADQFFTMLFFAVVMWLGLAAVLQRVLWGFFGRFTERTS